MNIPPNTVQVLRNVPLPDEAAVMHTNAAVLDVGGHSTRLGFAGDTAPRLRQRTCVVKGRATLEEAYTLLDDHEVPDACAVMEKGVIKDWAAYEELLERVVRILDIGNSEYSTPLMMTEKALVPSHQRQKIAELLFEKHQVAATSFALSPVLALYASGLCTGVSVELGYHQTHIVPVFQGLSLFHATHALDYGGAGCTQLFTDMMAKVAAARVSVLPSMTSTQQQSMWEYIKERYGAVADDRQSYEMGGRAAGGVNSSGTSSGGYGGPSDGDDRLAEECVLPDGTVLPISAAARYTPGEGYFQPSLCPALRQQSDQADIVDEVLLRTSRTTLGLPQHVVDSLQRSDVDLLSTLASSVVLSGGASMLRGMPQRLEAEVQSELDGRGAVHARVNAESERRDAAFIGGSIWASLPAVQSLWVTKRDYEEAGPSAVVRGCF